MIKALWGFDNANQLIQRVDKYSVGFILKRYGATIGDNCDIETGLIFHNCGDYSNLIIGNNCHIGKNCFFDLMDQVIIGNNVVISMQCTFITHIDMNKSELSKLYPSIKGSIKLEDHVYVGANATILMNIVIETKSFITAHALVNNHVPALTMFGGIPARKIKDLEYN